MKNEKPRSETEKRVLKLIERINKSKRRIARQIPPLTYKNDGWRVVFPKSLEFYDFLPAGRKLIQISIYDLDMNGGYYWVPLSEPPKGVVTPAIRLMQL